MSSDGSILNYCMVDKGYSTIPFFFLVPLDTAIHLSTVYSYSCVMIL